jgi:hypothetical protein
MPTLAVFQLYRGIYQCIFMLKVES